MRLEYTLSPAAPCTQITTHPGEKFICLLHVWATEAMYSDMALCRAPPLLTALYTTASHTLCDPRSLKM